MIASSKIIIFKKISGSVETERPQSIGLSVTDLLCPTKSFIFSSTPIP